MRGSEPEPEPDVEPERFNWNNYGVQLVAQWENLLEPRFGSDNESPLMVNFFVARGSVLDFTGDAIVNATNESCIGQYGVDGAITKAGGQSYAEQIIRLPVKATEKINGNKIYKKRLLPGNALIIESGKETNNLKTDYVILTVGPRYHKNSIIEKADEQLSYSYQSCMKQANEKNIETIGFCLISAGLFRGHGKLPTILKIGCEAIKNTMYDSCKAVFMIAYTKDELDALLNAAKDVFGEPLKQF